MKKLSYTVNTSSLFNCYDTLKMTVIPLYKLTLQAYCHLTTILFKDKLYIIYFIPLSQILLFGIMFELTFV